jgi:hypothetical protein
MSVPSKVGVQRILGLVGALLVAAGVGLPGGSVPPARASSGRTLHLPIVMRAPAPTPVPAGSCPATSSNQYSQGIAYQYDLDNPVRPAQLHADKNLNLRSYTPNNESDLQRGLVGYGTDDPNQPPQFATLFNPSRVPALVGFYRVYNWNWAPSPDPGTRGAPLTQWRVTALGLRTTPGEALRVPIADLKYTIGQGMQVVVLYADEDTIALRYTREDSSGSQGYTVHVDKICTDPNLLALYRQLDDPNGPRYRYPSPSYNLPVMPAGKVFGTARGNEAVVAIVDTGPFMDPRSCDEWWQVRPGYSGGCPWHR